MSSPPQSDRDVELAMLAPVQSPPIVPPPGPAVARAAVASSARPMSRATLSALALHNDLHDVAEHLSQTATLVVEKLSIGDALRSMVAATSLRILKHPLKVISLSLQGCCYLTFGVLLSLMFSTGHTVAGVGTLFGGLGFVAGFSMVILSGTTLFTEANVSLMAYVIGGERRKVGRLVFYWIIAFVGNYAGALLLGLIFRGAAILQPAQRVVLTNVVTHKLEFANTDAAGWFSILLSGVVANWLVGTAALFSGSARSVPGKVWAVMFPVLAFFGSGSQHSPANMGFFAIALIDGQITAPNLDWGTTIAWNLIPSGIGNLIGGTLFVTMLEWFGHVPTTRFMLDTIDPEPDTDSLPVIHAPAPAKPKLAPLPKHSAISVFSASPSQTEPKDD